MTMRIDISNYPPPLLGGEAAVCAPVTRQRSAATCAAASGATVNLGAASAPLHSKESGVVNTLPVNASKIAEIKQAISEGRIQVNSGAVADSLIKSVTDLIASHQA